MTNKIRILVVDDYAIVRAGLRAAINDEPDMVVVGEADDGETAVAQFQNLQPDVTVIDLVMPRSDGLSAIRTIKQKTPHARILVLTDYGDEEHVLAAMRANVVGYLLKDASLNNVIEAIRDIHRGKSALHSEVAQILLQAMQRSTPSSKANGLTNREKQVLQFVAQGFPNQVIGSRLGIDERTVRLHVTHILHKLKLENRTQAALYALRHGLAALQPAIVSLPPKK